MTQTYAGDTSLDAVVAPQPAAHVNIPLQNIPTRPAEPPFTVSTAALAGAVVGTPWRITVIVSPTVGGAEREPTDEELLQGLRELMAEDEHDLGPIPEEARAEVERQWRD